MYTLSQPCSIKKTGPVRITILAFALIVFASKALAQRPVSRFEPIREKIIKLVSEGKVPALSIGVAQEGKIIWEEGFGYIDRHKKTPAGYWTTYGIGSTTKPFTATAIMRLSERGKLDLDSPANQYLPKGLSVRSNFHDADKVTIRRILNHTSGLPRHSQFFIGSEIEQAMLSDRNLGRYAITIKPAGESFEYSNLGYGLLSRIIANISGLSYGEFLRREIFLPLGMNNTSLDPDRKRTAIGYSPQGVPVERVVADSPGSSDIFADVHDLLLFGMYHLGYGGPDRPAIVSDQSLATMHQPAASRGISYYGLGFESTKIGKYTRLFHDGSNGYGMSVFLLVPEKKICISILSNITSNDVAPLVNDILTELIPDYAVELEKYRSGTVPIESRTYEATDTYLGHWIGEIVTWKETLPFEAWFQPDGDIQIQIKGQYRSLLNGVRTENGYLRGSFQGDIGTDDARRHQYNLHLKLKLRNGRVLNGSITSVSTSPQGNVLSSWIELKKQE